MASGQSVFVGIVPDRLLRILFSILVLIGLSRRTASKLGLQR